MLALVLAAALAAPLDDWVIIVADDFSREEINATATPTLDAMRCESIDFQNAYADTVCSPSRHRLFFGLHSYRSVIGTIINNQGQQGIPDVDNPSPSMELPSIADLAQLTGHTTALFGKWNLTNDIQGPKESNPRARGFATWRAGSTAGVGPGYAGGTTGNFTWSRVDDGIVSSDPNYNSAAIETAFSDWWTASAGKDRFAVVCWNTPHAPFHYPPLVSGPEDDRSKYLAMVADMDTRIGNIRALVGAETWIVFAGDNGTPPQVPFPGGAGKVKGTMYQGGIRIPLMFRPPASRMLNVGTVPRHVVGLEDLWATLADVWGATCLPVPIDSESLYGVLQDPIGAPQVKPYAFAEYWRPNGPNSPKEFVKYAVRERRYKLLWDDVGGYELYDLAADPLELFPLDLQALSMDEQAAYDGLHAEMVARASFGSL